MGQLYSQAPQGFNYQAVARNSSGEILQNRNIGIRFTITSDNGGTLLYQETQTTTTNQFGLFTLNVGKGSSTFGNFSSIQWATINAWLQVEMDPEGGTAYVNMGTSQLLSVPYSLFAASGNPGPPGADGDRYTTTSSSLMTIGIGTHNLIVDTSLNYSIGQTVIIANTVNNLMTGMVVSYNGVTGAMIVNVNSIAGNGSFSTWNISLTGATGPQGLRGPMGYDGDEGPEGPEGPVGPPGLLTNGTATGNTPYWNGPSWIVNSNNIYNNNGNVGIGTSNPIQKLDVNGSIRQQVYSFNYTWEPESSILYAWNHNLGYLPVLMISLDETGGSNMLNCTVTYNNYNLNNTQIIVRNNSIVDNASGTVRWILVH